MCLDEHLTKAFGTIREAAYVDSRSLVPHPDILRFQGLTERHAMHRLGTKLDEIVSSPDSEDLLYAAHTVKRHFRKELGHAQPLELATEVPRFCSGPTTRWGLEQTRMYWPASWSTWQCHQHRWCGSWRRS